jgi:hypothetical protein
MEPQFFLSDINCIEDFVLAKNERIDLRGKKLTTIGG